MLLASSVLFFSISYAQESTLAPSSQTFEKAVVLEVLSEGSETIPGTGIVSDTQMLKVEILSGSNVGKIININNDYNRVSVGDELYARHTVDNLSDIDFWSVSDIYRIDILVILSVVFVIILFLFGGIQGVRGLLSLIGSIMLIFYVLIPGIYNGYPALLMSIIVSSFIIILGSYITHGFNRTTSSAVLGMIITVCATGVATYFAISYSHLSGFSSEEHTYLNLDTKGKIDMIGLLMGGIIIGLLGVLYDMAIGQAVSVEELYKANSNANKLSVYKSAIRIGREHIGALVNTLAIAYVGVSLPLLLLIQSSTTSITFIINSEIFATELIRILVSSIGLVLAVPITTIIAVQMLFGRKYNTSGGEGKLYHTHHH